MLKTTKPKRRRFVHDPSKRGYLVVYRENEVNHCPACGRSHWYVGRLSAECAFCATALPLAEATARGAGSWVRDLRCPGVEPILAA